MITLDKKQVLDYGFVSLVDVMGDDNSIVKAARVMPEAERRGEKDDKLIKYMLDHHHTSPFEHVAFTFHVNAPIFVWRQWMRHRTWSYNEASARYSPMSGEYYTPEPANIGVQNPKSHQSRDLDENPNALMIRNTMQACISAAVSTYYDLLQQGCPREIARNVLPVSMYSEAVATVDLWNLIHFLKLRLDPHAQWEIHQYAKALLELVTPVVPVTMEALNLGGDDGENA